MYREHHGVLFGVLGAVAFSAMAVFVKLAALIPNETIVFFRFFIPLLLLYFFGNRKKLHFSVRSLPKHLIRAIAGLAAMYCYFYALKKLPVATAVTLSSTMPLFVPFVVLIWHKLLVSKRRFIAAAIGFLGVVIIMRPSQGFLEWPAAAGLVSGLLAAIALVGLRHLSKSEPPQTILLYYFIIASVASFFPMIYGWEPIATAKLWILLLGISVFGFFYQYFLTLAYTHAPATKASAPTYLAVVFSGITDWLIWDQVPSLWIIIGMLLIILGGTIALLDQTPPRQIKLK